MKRELDFSQERVLVVDDEPSLRKAVSQMLRHLGFLADAIEDGKSALHAIKDESYTFMLTDIRMPVMDGLELIRRVKAARPDICSIAMTAYSKEYRYMDVLKAGATDFINKPFDMGELEAKFTRAILERNTREELSRLSITDSLTGLYNQRHFYNRLRDEITRAQRQNNQLALILLDLDSFKQYNDEHGHLAGDEVLRGVGKIINANIRQGVDSGYRYGGDEFSVILIDADSKIGESIGARIEAAIEMHHLTASMGYAYYEKGMSLEDFISKADQNLYDRKGTKKNNTARA